MTTGLPVAARGRPVPTAEWRRWFPVATSLVVAAVSTWLLVRLLGPIGFSADEWVFVADRHDWSIRSLMRAHNGHPAILPALSYLVGFHTVGLGSMWYYKAVLITVHLGVCALVARHVWRRHGSFVALAAWMTVCFMGAGAQNIVQLFQIGLVGSVLFFLVSLVVLERLMSSGRRRDALWLALALTASIACSTVGLSAVAAAGVVLVTNRKTWPHLWSVVAPAGLYLVWRSVYGEPTATSDDWGVMLRFVWAAVRTCGAALGFGNEFLGAALVCGVFLVAGWRVATKSTPLLMAGPVFTISFWVLTALGRADFQAANGDISPLRYRYVAIVGLLVTLNDLVPPAGRERVRRLGASTVVAAAATTSVWVGHAGLIEYRDMFANWYRITEARLAVVDAHPDAVAGDKWVDPMLANLDPSLVVVSDYLEASRSLDSRGGMTPAEFAATPSGYLFGAEELVLPLLEASVASSTGCTQGDARATAIVLDPGDAVIVEVGANGTLVASRWLDPEPAGPGFRTLAPGLWRIGIPTDDLPGAWTVSAGGDVRLLRCQ